ncbi:MAG: hypothetical protein NTY74_14730 [Ignavibacteriae bacterium]|nr:hypothetical protein [Ignavibacteriota bacterium]
MEKFPLQFSANTVCGDYILKSIQDFETPTIDLLIRESIQNSLDAAKKGSDLVKVEFNLNKIQTKELINTLSLNNSDDLPQESNVLEIRDSGTEGLTGYISFDDVKSGSDMGNYLKLVASLGMNQEKEGSGGSWGLGKTIFYRLGLGLVFYYSRIATGESRLIACWIESQKKDDGILKKMDIQTGVCWWGKTINNNNYPLTEFNNINSVLNMLSVNPFTDHETGTSIIIPFLNEEIASRFISNPGSIKDCVLKWYTPRISNFWDLSKVKLNSGPRLEVRLDKEIIKIGYEPFYIILSVLHRYAVSGLTEYIEDNPDLPELKFWKRECIKRMNKLVGWLTWVEVNGSHLKLSNGNRSPDEIAPLDFYTCTGDRGGGGKPLIAMIRKPGMIVEFKEIDTSSKVLPGKWIFGVFVLNSADNEIEEYFRSCERANHFEWKNPQNQKPNYQQLVDTKIKKLLEEKLKSEVKESDIELAFDLSNQIADIFMPKDGMGNRPNIDSMPIKPSTETPKKFKRSKTPSIRIDEIIYSNNGDCMLNINAFAPAGKNIYLELCVSGDSKLIDYNSWANNFEGKEFPFKITEADLKYKIEDQDIDIPHESVFLNIRNNIIEIKFNPSLNQDVVVCGIIFFTMIFKDISFSLIIEELKDI